MSILPTTSSLASAPTWDGDRRVAGGALAGDPPALKGDDAFTVGDFLSILNPLQHIPVVSNIYRWITGDTIKPAARVIGGALYGGPIGLVSAALNAVVEQVKGQDVGTQLMAMVTPDRTAPAAAPEVAVAAAERKDAPAEGAEALLQLAADLRSGGASNAETNLAEATPVPVTAPILPGPARTLAFYQANAGQRLPGLDNGRNGPPPKYALPAMLQTPTSKALPLPVADEKSGAPDAAAPQAKEGAPDAWFASAMMHGLDRYRATQQLNKAAPQVDVTQ